MVVLIPTTGPVHVSQLMYSGIVNLFLLLDINTGAIIGGTLGSVAGVVVISVVVFLVLRDKHKKGQLKNPFRNVRNPFRNVRNPFRNIQWNVPQTTTTPAPARATIELETVPAPPTNQPHPQEPTRQPPPSYNPNGYPPASEPLPTAPQQEPLPYPTVGFGAGLAYPPPTQFGVNPPTTDPDYNSPVDGPAASDGEGLRKGEPPAYDPSWGYPPTY